MPAPHPAILVCSSVAWRLDRLAAALDRILAALPGDLLASARLGYRPREDLAVIVLVPGRSAGPRFGSIALAEARFVGLRSLDPTAGGLRPEEGVERALQGCGAVLPITGGAGTIAQLRRELGMTADRRTPTRLPAATPVRFPSLPEFLEACGGDLSTSTIHVTSPERPAIGSSIPLELHLPGDSDPLRTMATVVQHHPPGQPPGFEALLVLAEAARLRLAGIVRRLRAAPPQDSRRAAPRVPVRLEVTLTTDAQVAREVTENLSRGGAFVACSRPPPMGSRVALTLVLPDGSTLELPGEVVRVIEGATAGAAAGCGVSFRDLPDAARVQLEAFVDAWACRPAARILIVDDTALFRTMLADALTVRGCEVLQAATGAEAFGRLVDELLHLDLLVLDLNLPDMSGQELLSRIRDLGGETELGICVVSGSVDSPQVQAELILSGADEVLPKSLTPPALADRIVAMVEARRRSGPGLR